MDGVECGEAARLLPVEVDPDPEATETPAPETSAPPEETEPPETTSTTVPEALDAGEAVSRHPANREPERIANGDRHALRNLYSTYYHPLLRFIYRITGRLDLAQEGVNDVMLVVWRNGRSFGGRPSTDGDPHIHGQPFRSPTSIPVTFSPA